jgi:uncharacterized protein (TIGR02145 family)
MKTRIALITLLSSLVIFYGCKKEKPSSTTIPILTTIDVTSITQNAAVAGGSISSDGGSTIIEKGICWSTDTMPTILSSKSSCGSDTSRYLCDIDNLIVNSTYCVCSYAINDHGIGYGNKVYFTTPGGKKGTVTDVDGNVYPTVTIGNQVWMAENLKTTKYRNGDPIPFISTASGHFYKNWCDLTTGAYCFYYDNTNNLQTYGNLYNWWAVNDPRKIAPTGWHIPSIEDWKLLIRNIGGEKIAGGNLKEIGTEHWIESNIGATDIYDFAARPGGELQSFDCSLVIINYLALFWSSSSFNNNNGYYFMLEHGASDASFGKREKVSGLSIRCIQD